MRKSSTNIWLVFLKKYSYTANYIPSTALRIYKYYLFNSYYNPIQEAVSLALFTDEKTEAPKGWVICPRSYTTVVDSNSFPNWLAFEGHAVQTIS